MSSNPPVKGVTIPEWAANAALLVFRAAVVLSCATAWSMYLDLRDIKHERIHDPPFAKRDWEYERRLLLVEHEALRSELAVLRRTMEEEIP